MKVQWDCLNESQTVRPERRALEPTVKSWVCICFQLHIQQCQVLTQWRQVHVTYQNLLYFIVTVFLLFSQVSFLTYTSTLFRRRQWHPTPVLLPGKSMDGGAWQAVVHGVTKGWTQLSDFTFTFYTHALEKEMATHSSILAWRIPGMGELGGLLSLGSHRVGHD